MIQFLRWVAERARTYADVMEACRTSCPRQSVWEDAQADGLVEVGPHTVKLTVQEKLCSTLPLSDRVLPSWTSY